MGELVNGRRSDVPLLLRPEVCQAHLEECQGSLCYSIYLSSIWVLYVCTVLYAPCTNSTFGGGRRKLQHPDPIFDIQTHMQRRKSAC